MTDKERLASEARRLSEEPLLVAWIAHENERDLRELLTLKDWRLWRRDAKRSEIINRINLRNGLLAHLRLQIAMGAAQANKTRLG